MPGMKSGANVVVGAAADSVDDVDVVDMVDGVVDMVDGVDVVEVKVAVDVEVAAAVMVGVWLLCVVAGVCFLFF
jgi:hypothetical protein